MDRLNKRTSPNVLVTGTPCVGKSSLCKRLQDILGLQWIEVSSVARKQNCLAEYDHEYNCPVLDEDKLLDHLEDRVSAGGTLVDYHSSEFFPERWFDIVFVLTTSNTMLYDRLVERGYSGKKLEDNVQCEIFQTILEETRQSYKSDIIHVLNNSSLDDLDRNLTTVCTIINNWMQTQNDTCEY